MTDKFVFLVTRREVNKEDHIVATFVLAVCDSVEVARAFVANTLLSDRNIRVEDLRIAEWSVTNVGFIEAQHTRIMNELAEKLG